MNTHDMIELPPLRIPDLEDELTAVLCAAISWGGSVISSEEYVAAKQRFRAAVNAALEADRKRRGEPVAWRVHPFDYGVGYEGVYALTSRPDQVAAWERNGWEVQPLFTAPQPAEPCASSVSNKTACGSENGKCDSQPAEPDSAKCAECGAEMIHVRPGKWQHPDCPQSPRTAEPVKEVTYCQHPRCLTAAGCSGPCRYGQPAEPVKRKRRYEQGTALGEFGIIPMCDQVDDEPVKVPSDAEIGQILKEVLHNSPYGVHQWELWLEFASALFTRYGGGTP